MRCGDKHSFKIRPEILNIAPYSPGKPIDEVKRELGLREVIKLASNEFPYAPVDSVKEAIFKAASEINRYPDAQSYYLKKEISEKYSVGEDKIAFGNGSSELLKLIVDCLVVPGDKVIYADPSFVMYPIVTKSRGAKSVPIPLTQSSLSHDIDEFLNQADSSTSLIIICNPNNPTGTITPRREIDKMLTEIGDGTFILFDEAYEEYVDNKNYKSGLKYFKEGWPNIGVIRSFSKAYGLAGLRLGFGFLPEKLVDAVNKIREPFNVNLIGQKAAIAALKAESEYEAIRKKIMIERSALEEQLKEAGFKVYPSQANFVFIDVGVDSTRVFNKLLKKGIIVRNGSIFGKKFETCIRATVGSEDENNKLVSSLKNTVEEIKRKGH